VLSSFQDEGEGTLITFEEDEKMEKAVISGLHFNRDEAKITVMACRTARASPTPYWARSARANIDVDMIIQNASVDGMTDLSFTVGRNEYQEGHGRAQQEGQGPHQGHRHPRRQQDLQGLDCRVGMRTHAGIASKAFRTLSEEGINIQMISTSEIKISVVIDEKYMSSRCARCTGRSG